MTAQKNHWTQKEFLAYLLLYAAHADVQFKESERNHILSKIEQDVYEKAWKEFSLDNGYVQVQKILSFQKRSDYISNEFVIQEIQDLFLSDNHFHRMEKFTLSNIRRLLN